MKPALKKEDADQLTDKILKRLAQDIPVETITNSTSIEPLKYSWIGRLVATFALLFLSITALQESHNSAFPSIDWSEKPNALIVEIEREESSSNNETLENPNKAALSEITVAHLEYDQPIAEGPIVYEATETITLRPGFAVKAGVVFTASISNSQSLSLE